MAKHDEHVRQSVTRIISAREETARIERALEEVMQQLARSGPSVTTGHLEVSLAALGRIVDSWDTLPPTAAQVSLVRDRVAELLQQAKRSAPTVKPPSLKLRRSA